MRTLPITLPLARGCACGAAVQPGQKRCIKCRARARWHRRKAHHDGICPSPPAAFPGDRAALWNRPCQPVPARRRR
jgi:hypothetical protein